LHGNTCSLADSRHTSGFHRISVVYLCLEARQQARRHIGRALSAAVNIFADGIGLSAREERNRAQKVPPLDVHVDQA
jgi:hypothetical protein